VATSPAAWTYLAMHGSYGLVWLLKDMVFPAIPTGRAAPPGGLPLHLTGLALYWGIGGVLISACRTELSVAAGGVVLALRHAVRDGAIIMSAPTSEIRAAEGESAVDHENGLFAWVRHPNYLGEMMIYAASA